MGGLSGLRLLLVATQWRCCVAQPWNMGLPSHPHLGYRFLTNHSAEHRAVASVDFFFDFLCPDSKAAWPPLEAAVRQLDEKSVRVELQLHMFPLPYHRNGMLVAQAATVVANHSADRDSGFLKFQQEMFGAQEKFWNAASSTKSLVETTLELKAHAINAAPGLTDAQWAEGMSLVPGTAGTAADMKTREAWKYGAYRGATGTPAIFVNDVPFNTDPLNTGKPMNASAWETLLSSFASH